MSEQLSTIDYLKTKVGEVLCFKLKNGKTIFGKLEQVDDQTIQPPEDIASAPIVDFEILLAAPIEMVGAIMPTQQGPAPIEMPLPYFSMAPSSSIPFMKNELSMMAEASKEHIEMWTRANSPIDLESKIQL